MAEMPRGMKCSDEDKAAVRSFVTDRAELSGVAVDNLEAVCSKAFDVVQRDVKEDPALIEQFENEDFLESYARREIDPIISEALCGRSIARYPSRIVPPGESRLERLAVHMAMTDHGMSMADAEFIADRASANITGAMHRTPGLKERLILEPKVMAAYLRKTVARLSYEVHQHNNEREQRSKDALRSLLAGGESDEDRRRLNEILDAAIQNAGLTDTEKRRVNKVRQNLGNVEIGNDEGVSEAAIRKSVKTAIAKISAYLAVNGPGRMIP